MSITQLPRSIIQNNGEIEDVVYTANPGESNDKRRPQKLRKIKGIDISPTILFYFFFLYAVDKINGGDKRMLKGISTKSKSTECKKWDIQHKTMTFYTSNFRQRLLK